MKITKCLITHATKQLRLRDERALERLRAYCLSLGDCRALSAVSPLLGCTALTPHQGILA
jgi:hypothetical protein